MPYVGTPRYLGNDRDTLASVIQGEAGGEGLTGMRAVAQVIQNRANVNYSGYGSGLVDQALAPRQFQGQSYNTPSAGAYQAADEALSGRLPNTVGSGAVNYANPNTSTPGNWGSRLNEDNSFRLGNHYFTDNTRGRPYEPDLSQNNGTVPDASAGSTGTAGGNSSDGLNYGGYDGGRTSAGNGAIVGTYTGDGSVPGVNDQGMQGVVLGDDGSIQNSVGAGDFAGGYNVAGGVGNASVTDGLPQALSGNGPDLAGATLGGDVSASSILGDASGGGGTGGNISGFNAAGPVQGSPGIVSATEKVASNTKEGDKQIGSDVKTAGQTVGQAITSTGQSWRQWATDFVLRFFVLIIGIVFVAGALYYFARPEVDEAVGKLAKAV